MTEGEMYRPYVFSVRVKDLPRLSIAAAAAGDVELQTLVRDAIRDTSMTVYPDGVKATVALMVTNPESANIIKRMSGDPA